MRGHLLVIFFLINYCSAFSQVDFEYFIFRENKDSVSLGFLSVYDKDSSLIYRATSKMIDTLILYPGNYSFLFGLRSKNYQDSIKLSINITDSTKAVQTVHAISASEEFKEAGKKEFVENKVYIYKFFSWSDKVELIYPSEFNKGDSLKLFLSNKSDQYIRGLQSTLPVVDSYYEGEYKIFQPFAFYIGGPFECLKKDLKYQLKPRYDSEYVLTKSGILNCELLYEVKNENSKASNYKIQNIGDDPPLTFFNRQSKEGVSWYIQDLNIHRMQLQLKINEN